MSKEKILITNIKREYMKNLECFFYSCKINNKDFSIYAKSFNDFIKSVIEIYLKNNKNW